MYGFIYLWRDAKHKRFYLGSHTGAENDGYICGSKRMLRAFRERPHDFRRRIILHAEVNSHIELKEIEQRVLDLIKGHEFGTRYYNVSPRAYGADPVLASKWMRGNQHGKGKPCSEEKRRKIALAQIGKIIPAHQREKMRKAKLGKKQTPQAIEARFAKIRGIKRPLSGINISAAKKRKNAERRAILGYVHSEETRAKIAASQRVRMALRRKALLMSS